MFTSSLRSHNFSSGITMAIFLVKSDNVGDEKGLVLDNTKHIFEHNKPAPGLKDDLANRIKEAIT